MKKDIEGIADELIGSCAALEDVIGSDELTPEECAELDSLASRCEVCGWWEAPEDMHGDSVCNSCRDD